MTKSLAICVPWKDVEQGALEGHGVMSSPREPVELQKVLFLVVVCL